ncbi:MAG: phosphoribosylaminoimidazolesuccinocarboxamide synthase [Patescibacteria group bacterium]
MVENDLIAAGSGIDAYLPKNLVGNADLQARATVVKKLDMIPIEAIVRNCLTGTGLKAYNETQQVCGHRLPKGLQDGDKLPYLLFTPTTKADVGHDEHVTADIVADEHGFDIERTSIQIFSLMQQFAHERGIILADTKFEFGEDRDNDCALVLGDEVATPDSSRYWDVEVWQTMQKSEKRKSPPSFDKQYVREWGIGAGINKRDPLVAEDVAWVHAQEVPEDIINGAVELYRHIFYRLTGHDLEAYQQKFMGIAA